MNSSGFQGNLSSYDAQISNNGRFVAFTSQASNLVPGDGNGFIDVFLFDPLLRLMRRVSVGSAGEGAGPSDDPSISEEGRYVAFASAAPNLVPDDAPGPTNVRDVFVRDVALGTTTRVSVNAGGAQGNGDSRNPSISSDGRFVAFESLASNLVAGDTNAAFDVFLKDLQTGAITRVSVDSAGAQAGGPSGGASISADGRFVSFQSAAANLVAGDTNICPNWGPYSIPGSCPDVFVRDVALQTTVRISVGPAGQQVNFPSQRSSIGAAGRLISWDSFGSSFVAGDTNGTGDVFLRDRDTDGDGVFDEPGAVNTIRVSVGTGGYQANGESFGGQFSADGRFVIFASKANNLVHFDTERLKQFPRPISSIILDANGVPDVFVRDNDLGLTFRVSVDSLGREASPFLGRGSDQATISDDGRFVAFGSWAPNLVAQDTNASQDVFIRDWRVCRGRCPV